ncbi:MAG TPA: hypothetical protein VFW23_00130 [Tepidisphaeraceae bacterium]|nr:hypothetical protein [Tepidisphaeraceae bacterium]
MKAERCESRSTQVIDYNGVGRWSRDEILRRYAAYAREMEIEPRDISPREHTEKGRHWIYPVMNRVIDGIAAGDPACIRLGIEFIEEDAKFTFGKRLKASTARALRRTSLSEEKKDRIRRRVFAMLQAGIIPHEYREYAKLIRKIGFQLSEVPNVDPANFYASRFRHYFQQAANEDRPGEAIAVTAPRERAVMMLVEWCVEDGTRVRKGQAVCKLEIAWAYETPHRQELLEITSPVAGALFQMARAGDVLGAGQQIANVIPSQGAP